MSRVNFYETLGISRDAGLAEIRTAYVRQLRFSHPDVTRSVAPQQARLHELQRAYRCLRHAETRQEHDALLSSYDRAHVERLRRVRRRLESANRGTARRPGSRRAVAATTVITRRAWALRLALIAMVTLIVARLLVGPG